MIDLYTAATPNGHKVSIALEELGLPYEVHALRFDQQEQKAADYLKINPNGRIPAIVDRDMDNFAVFESGAILLYLAEKTGEFLPGKSPKERGEMLSWLMFVASGIGPYSGQSVHFRNFAPEPKEYAVNRYTFEARRHWDILEARLGKHGFMCGEAYTIVDMAVWGWSRLIPNVLGPDAVKQLPNQQRHLGEISARPAAVRALALKDKHSFKTEMDDTARHAMFPHLAKKVA
jgi:GST-like protein